MKQLLSLAIALIVVMPVRAQVSFGEAHQFNEGWLFAMGDDQKNSGVELDDSKWRKLTLPHDWSIEGLMSPSLASCTGYLPAGIAWYRKHFDVNDTEKNRYVYFEGAYNRSEVYLNGHLLGKRPNGYISFMYDMTPYIKPKGNVLAVRIDHSRHADSRWYTGSGIYRDVWMIEAGDVHFAQWGMGWTSTDITKSRAVLNVDAEVVKHKVQQGSMAVRATLYDAEGNKVAEANKNITDKAEGTAKVTMSMKVSKPKLWQLDNPYLYKLECEITVEGKQVDKTSANVGFRTLAFDANKGFALNGKNLKIKGVCLHHDAGVLGAVVPDDVWRRRLENLKEMGANAIRMSHNPQAPVVYHLCDKLGLLVMDEASDEWEFPKRKWVQGWNVGTPSYDGTFDFFEEWIERDVTDMVRRDRNHPSVFLWSIGNEVDYPNDPYSHPVLNGTTINQPMFGGYKPDAPDAMRIGKIAKRLAKCVRSIDTSRPVTGALAGVVMSNQTEYPEAIDVVGYNYTENRYDEDHKQYPDRIIYGSETHTSLAAWKAVRDREHIFGQFVWTGTDYLGESGRWPSRGLHTGLLDFGSYKKPRGWFRASLWSEKPVTYIGTYQQMRRRNTLSPEAPDVWNYEDGQKVRVVCYTNSKQARLILNGKQVGGVKDYDNETGIIHWDVDYQPGTLVAEGLDANGNVESRYTIRTSGRPYAIKATLEDKGEKVAHVRIEVVDENGIVVKLADNEIACWVMGGKLLGLENSNNSDMTDHRDNRQRVYRGQLLAYVQMPGDGGETVLRLTSPLLKSAELRIK